MNPFLSTTAISSHTDGDGANKLIGGMTAVGILAALELVIILGMCFCFPKKYKPDLLKRHPKVASTTAEPDAATYYDSADQSIRTTRATKLSSAPVESVPDYAEVDMTAEYTAVVKSPDRKPNGSVENDSTQGDFANNEMYE